jgi:hypothetical protein
VLAIGPPTPGRRGIVKVEIYDILTHVIVSRMGLYYPYVHFRNKDWLKFAALYWPKMGRIVTDGYPVHDDSITRALIDELDFVINISPSSASAEASRMMLEVLNIHGDRLQELYKVPPDSLSDQEDDYQLAIDNWVDRITHGVDKSAQQYAANALRKHHMREAPIYARRLIIALQHELVHRRMAARSDPRLALHPKVAWVYMCVLAEQLARRNNLSPVTDQTLAHIQPNEWTSDRIVRALLEPYLRPAVEPTPETTIGLLAIRLVVPTDLKHLSVKKVIRLRQRYAADFDAFHDAVTATASELCDEFTDIADRAVVEAYLHQAVKRRFEQPLADLRKAFKGLGIDTTFAAANMKFELPTALVTGSGIIAHQPVLAGAGAAAFGVVTLGRGTRLKWIERTKPSAASYLWRVERGELCRTGVHVLRIGRPVLSQRSR